MVWQGCSQSSKESAIEKSKQCCREPMTTNPPTVLPEEPTKRPPLAPILITMLCSLALAGGSCFAALRTFGADSSGLSWWGFFIVAFLLTALMFVVACFWLIVRVVRNLSS